MINERSSVLRRSNDPFQYEYNEKYIKPYNLDEGCDDVFKTIAISPTNTILGCCGLTVLHNLGFQLGKLAKNNLWPVYSEQYNDFLKIWIFVDDPQKIYATAKKWNDKIAI